MSSDSSDVAQWTSLAARFWDEDFGMWMNGAVLDDCTNGSLPFSPHTVHVSRLGGGLSKLWMDCQDPL